MSLSRFEMDREARDFEVMDARGKWTPRQAAFTAALVAAPWIMGYLLWRLMWAN